MILALDSSSPVHSVALLSGYQVVASVTGATGSGAENITQLVGTICADGKQGPGQFDTGQVTKVVVAVGPGSFTGARSGIAVAQGVAKGLKVPVVGVSMMFGRLLPVVVSCVTGAPSEVINCFLRASPTEYFLQTFAINRSKRSNREGDDKLESIIQQFDYKVCSALSVIKAEEIGQVSGRLNWVVESGVTEGGASAGPTGAELVAFAANLSDDGLVAAAEFDEVVMIPPPPGVLRPIYGKGVNARTLAERAQLANPVA